MKRGIGIGLILVLWVPALVDAAPDTPPAVTWNIPLPEPTGDPCPSTATLLIDIAVAKDGYIYTLERCIATDESLIVRRVSPNGVIIWTVRTESGTNGDAVAYSIDADPAGRVWIWYADTLEVISNKKLVVRNKVGDVVIVKSNAAFSADTLIDKTTFEETGPSSFIAYAGSDSGARIAYDCTAITTCTEFFETYGQPGAGSINYAGPYEDILYGADVNDGSGQNRLMILNQATGAYDTNVIMSGTTTFSGTPFPWYNPATDAIGTPGQSLSGGRHNHYQEYNKTTLSFIRNVDPIENRVYGYSENGAAEAFIDGAGDVFYCGNANGVNLNDPYLAKYNSTTNMGMRWNVTFGVLSSSNVEVAQACALSNDGSIYVGWWGCTGASCNSYLRKYAGAATSRESQSLFTANWGGTTSTTTTTSDGNVLKKAAGFCSESWGFDCSWLFLMGIVAAAVVAVKNSKVLVIAIVGLLATVASIKILGLSDWLILVIVFLIIAVAGTRLFGGKGEGEDE